MRCGTSARPTWWRCSRTAPTWTSQRLMATARRRYTACQEATPGRHEALAANANVDRAAQNGCTPLYIACQNGHTEVVAKLLAANADVEQAPIEAGERRRTPMATACHFGHFGCVQLLCSTARPAPSLSRAERHGGVRRHRRRPPRSPPGSSAPPLVDGAPPPRDPRPSARALLRAGADILHAAAEPGGPTPLSLARAWGGGRRGRRARRRSSSSRRRSRGAARRTSTSRSRRARAPGCCASASGSSASRATSIRSRCSRCS